MRVIAIMQARMGSKRLPGKVLMPLGGKPVLRWALERVQRARMIDDLVLATSREKRDDPLERLASELGVPCFRGAEEDVLDRYYHAARVFNAETIVRLSGDNPLVDACFVDWVVGAYSNDYADYVAAVPGRQWGLPVGLAAEAFSFDALSRAWSEDADCLSREHVTTFIRNSPDRFRIRYLKAPFDCSSLYLAVDTGEDLATMEGIFEDFGSRRLCWKQALDAIQQKPGLLTARTTS